MHDRKLVFKLVAMTFVMFLFGFAMVPLYDVFCDLTGLGGKVDLVAAQVDENVVVDRSRTVKIEFVASLGPIAAWEFHPEVTSMRVHPGELNKTSFYAHNLTTHATTAQAVPSIAPGTAVEYLHKIECFCFTTQSFGPDEARDMPLVFTISPDLPDYIDTMTLSYTFYTVDGADE